MRRSISPASTDRQAILFILASIIYSSSDIVKGKALSLLEEVVEVFDNWIPMQKAESIILAASFCLEQRFHMLSSDLLF